MAFNLPERKQVFNEKYSGWLVFFHSKIMFRSGSIIQNIHDSYFLCNIVENDFVNGDGLSKFMNELSTMALGEKDTGRVNA